MDFKKLFRRSDNENVGFLSWANLRDCSILLVLVAFAYRLAVSEITVDLSGFGFTDLLSLILAIAAIVLSAAFYFKADESSKNFYNNSYEFTKNISELLGRIEERFGAQLLSINKGYDDLNNKFGELPLDVRKVKAEQEKERVVLEKTDHEYQSIIDDLMVKAKMDDADMSAMKNHMAELSKESERAKLELARHTASLNADKQNPLAMSDELFEGLKSIARDRLGWQYKRLGSEAIIDQFNKAVRLGFIDSNMVKELEMIGLCSGGGLNTTGAQFIWTLL